VDELADTQPRDHTVTDARAADEPVLDGSLELGRGTPLDRFLVIDRLGAGGMGVVVSAYDPQLDRKVAIKLLKPKAFAPEAAS
jgi:eukaryotic-like serine/threonine-protein kinase